MVCFEVSARFQGYWGQATRTCVIGKPSEKQRHIYETVMEAYQAMRSLLKPGIRASELFAVRNRVFTRAGYDTPVLLHGMRAGHGMGLTMAEGFDIYESDDTEMQSGFYLEIHDMVGVPEEGQLATLGNALLVTETGCEELNQAEYRLQV
jgi:Xaa-Pro aminopeptidase